MFPINLGTVIVGEARMMELLPSGIEVSNGTSCSLDRGNKKSGFLHIFLPLFHFLKSLSLILPKKKKIFISFFFFSSGK